MSLSELLEMENNLASGLASLVGIYGDAQAELVMLAWKEDQTTGLLVIEEEMLAWQIALDHCPIILTDQNNSLINRKRLFVSALAWTNNITPPFAQFIWVFCGEGTTPKPIAKFPLITLSRCFVINEFFYQNKTNPDQINSKIANTLLLFNDNKSFIPLTPNLDDSECLVCMEKLNKIITMHCCLCRLCTHCFVELVKYNFVSCPMCRSNIRFELAKINIPLSSILNLLISQLFEQSNAYIWIASKFFEKKIKLPLKLLKNITYLVLYRDKIPDQVPTDIILIDVKIEEFEPIWPSKSQPRVHIISCIE